MVQSVPEIQRVVEQQEPDDGRERLREMQPANEPEPPPCRETLDRRHDLRLGRRSRQRAERADRKVSRPTSRRGIGLPRKGPPPFNEEQHAGGDANRNRPPVASHAHSCSIDFAPGLRTEYTARARLSRSSPSAVSHPAPCASSLALVRPCTGWRRTSVARTRW